MDMPRLKIRKTYGSSRVLDERYREVLKDLKRVAKGETTIDEIAKKYNVSRATMFNWMNKKGITIKKLQEELKKEAEELLKKKATKKDIRLLPPSDFKEFLNIELVEKMINSMNSNNLSFQQIHTVVKTFYKLCKGFIGDVKGNKAIMRLYLQGNPYEDIETKDIVKIKVYDPVHPIRLDEELVSKYLSVLRSNGYNVNAVISVIQAIEKWTGLKLLPTGVEQQEYKGKYQEAELNVELRYLFLKTAKELYPQYYEKIRASSIYLFQGGGRKEALMTGEPLGWIETENEDIIQIYGGIKRFYRYRSYEKGKKGHKFPHIILIPEPFVKYVLGYIPLSRSEVNKLETILKDIFKTMIQRYRDKFNSHTLKYLGEKENDNERTKTRVYHIWRHSFAREGLRASKWKMYIVSKLGGWNKVDNLKIYGDYGVEEILQLKSQSKLLFLYNEWLEKAKKEGLL